MLRTLSLILFGSAVSAAVEAHGASDDVHAASPQISAEIAAGLPAFSPKGPAAANAAKPAGLTAKQGGAADGISTLPAITVNGARLPSEHHMLTYRGNSKKVMDAYLGDYDGFDRGVLNRFTLQQLWNKIPILGRLPFVGTPAQMSNEDRAFDRAGANDPLNRPHPAPE